MGIVVHTTAGEHNTAMQGSRGGKPRRRRRRARWTSQVIASIRPSDAKSRTDLQENHNIGMAEGWFMDDGQLFCRAQHVDRVLRRVDAGLNTIGASRGSLTAGDDIKSTVRVFGSAQNSDEWATDYIKDTCKIRTPSCNTKLLGGALGSAAHHAAIYAAAVS